MAPAAQPPRIIQSSYLEDSYSSLVLGSRNQYQRFARKWRRHATTLPSDCDSWSGCFLGDGGYALSLACTDGCCKVIQDQRRAVQRARRQRQLFTRKGIGR